MLILQALVAGGHLRPVTSIVTSAHIHVGVRKFLFGSIPHANVNRINL